MPNLKPFPNNVDFFPSESVLVFVAAFAILFKQNPGFFCFAFVGADADAGAGISVVAVEVAADVAVEVAAGASSASLA